METTFGAALALHNIEVPPHLEADMTVPVITGQAQVQGDVGIWPHTPGLSARDSIEVPAGGVQVVRGEATRNTHWLNNGNPDAAPCIWTESTNRQGDDVVLGVLEVPPGQVAYLIHTDEHGANGIGEGCYTITGQRQQLDEIERVAD